ncbi:ATP-binding cassette domain-containing protein, partial [Brasilonema sp. UFV-L1]|uniref:ATP-binding cassette domain-containing protein n=1 Tax=Brasilonema sp. UFV-L1 TaxID=2234130 RepID=UPI002006DE1D
MTSGSVYLNADNLRQNWAVYRSQIGYVSRDDIVHPDLTVEEVISYACKLRLPPDTNVKQIVETTLEQIKLSHVRHNFIRNLSGGQRKRVSIGVELLADPKLFFLDEPTSGLDPGLDKEMMRLLRARNCNLIS